MRSTDSGDAARRDLTALGDERVEELYFLVVDVVDLLDAEAADFLAPEILFLRRDGFVSTRRTLRCGYWPSTFAFRHIVSPLLLRRGRARDGCARRWTSRFRRHRGCLRRSGRLGRSRRGRGLPGSALLASLLPLLDALHLFVNAHRDEFKN